MKNLRMISTEIIMRDLYTSNSPSSILYKEKKLIYPIIESLIKSNPQTKFALIEYVRDASKIDEDTNSLIELSYKYNNVIFSGSNDIKTSILEVTTRYDDIIYLVFNLSDFLNINKDESNMIEEIENIKKWTLSFCFKNKTIFLDKIMEIVSNNCIHYGERVKLEFKMFISSHIYKIYKDVNKNTYFTTIKSNRDRIGKEISIDSNISANKNMKLKIDKSKTKEIAKEIMDNLYNKAEPYYNNNINIIMYQNRKQMYPILKELLKINQYGEKMIFDHCAFNEKIYDKIFKYYNGSISANPNNINILSSTIGNTQKLFIVLLDSNLINEKIIKTVNEFILSANPLNTKILIFIKYSKSDTCDANNLDIIEKSNIVYKLHRCDSDTIANAIDSTKCETFSMIKNRSTGFLHYISVYGKYYRK